MTRESSGALKSLSHAIQVFQSHVRSGVACKAVCLFGLLSVIRAPSLMAGDRLLSANRHAMGSVGGGDNRFSWSSSRSRLIGANNGQSKECRLQTLDLIEMRRKQSGRVRGSNMRLKNRLQIITSPSRLNGFASFRRHSVNRWRDDSCDHLIRGKKDKQHRHAKLDMSDIRQINCRDNSSWN
jgi:hypothetical protein